MPGAVTGSVPCHRVISASLAVGGFSGAWVRSSSNVQISCPDLTVRLNLKLHSLHCRAQGLRSAASLTCCRQRASSSLMASFQTLRSAFSTVQGSRRLCVHLKSTRGLPWNLSRADYSDLLPDKESHSFVKLRCHGLQHGLLDMTDHAITCCKAYKSRAALGI